MALFQPIQVGDMRLSHRVVMSPVTLFACNGRGEHYELGAKYYGQRASTKGTMIITEGTYIAERAIGWYNVPGIWTVGQIAGWKRVVDTVHERSSYIVLQILAAGRGLEPKMINNAPDFDYVGASDIPMPGYSTNPHPLTIPEIKEYVDLFAVAAQNAVSRAGFDAVEIHCANGYLIDQFLQTTSNNRTDVYGGSIENRIRFALEVIAAVVARIGPRKVGIRVSPWATFWGMGMKDPAPTFTELISRVRDLYPELAYLHIVEPCVNGFEPREVQPGESNDFLRNIWGTRPLISTGGYDREVAISTAEEKGGLIGFGRYFVANPDLPIRLKKKIRLAYPDTPKFFDKESEVGYTDYPFAEEERALALASDEEVGPTKLP